MLDFSRSAETQPLLIGDDDEPFRNRLARAMEKRGFAVTTAASVSEGCDVARRDKPTYAVLDLRLEDGSGLEIVKELQGSQPEARIIVLTGYGNIATTVAAVKAGAIDIYPNQLTLMQLLQHYLSVKTLYLHLQKIRCPQIELNGSISKESSSSVDEMCPKQPED